MNKQELIKKINEIATETPFPNAKIVDHSEVIKLIEQLDEPQKPVVPQFVADYIKYTKATDWDLQEAMDDVAYEDNKDLRKWFNNNIEIFARAWLDGFTVEKEKRYRVSLKNGQPLLKAILGKALYFSQDIAIESYKVTRKELEEAGFGWVLDCPGIDIEEVTE